METAKTIAIVGATQKMSAELALRLGAAGNNRLLLMSTDEVGLADLKSRIESIGTPKEIFTLSCSRDASWEADIIMVTGTAEAERTEAEKIRDVAVGKIVIHLSSLMESESHIVRKHDSAAESLQRLLPDSKVVGVYVAIGAESKSTEAFLTGNNGAAVEMISQIMSAAGFTTMVAGDLAVSRSLERMEPFVEKTLSERLMDYMGIGQIDLRQVLSYLRSMTRASR